MTSIPVPNAVHESGFTLVETMVVLTIAVILLTVAGPGFDRLVRDNRLTATSNAFAGTLNAARAQAITQRVTVTICGSSNGADCDGAWRNGWISFIDQDSDATRDGADVVLRHHAGLHASLVIGLTGTTTIRYGSQGFLRAGSDGVFRICDDRGPSYARALIVTGTGRVAIATDTDSTPDGIVDDTDGDNIECP